MLKTRLETIPIIQDVSRKRYDLVSRPQKICEQKVFQRQRPCSGQRVLVTSIGQRGSGRVFSGFGIWIKFGAGIGKTINILTGSGTWLFPGKRDLPKIGHVMRDLCLRVCRECRKPSRPTCSSGRSASTRRVLSGGLLSNQRPYRVECLVIRS